MSDPATVHNAFMLAARMYGELLADQERQIQFLKSQLESVQKAYLELQSRHDPKDVARPPGAVGVGQAAVGPGPLGRGGEETPRPGGVLQAPRRHEEVGEGQVGQVT